MVHCIDCIFHDQRVIHIKSRRYLVQQQNIRLEKQCQDQGNPMFFSTLEGLDIVFHIIGAHIEFGEQKINPLMIDRLFPNGIGDQDIILNRVSEKMGV